MTGEAYALSAEMGRAGRVRRLRHNRESMLGVMRLHRDAARAIDHATRRESSKHAAVDTWDRALVVGERHGYRNARPRCWRDRHDRVADGCDTTGVDRTFALVKFKKLAGGGYFKIVNQSVPLALERLG